MFEDKSFEKAHTHYITIQNAEYRASLISDVSFLCGLISDSENSKKNY